MKKRTIVLGAAAGAVGANLAARVVIASGGTLSGAAFLIGSPVVAALTPFWWKRRN